MAGSWGRSIGPLLLAVFLAACSAGYEPTTAGVVATFETPAGSDGPVTIRLADGRTLTLPRHPRIIHGSVLPVVGELLLLGGSPDDPWIARVPAAGTGGAVRADCFWVGGRTVELGDRIRTADGLLLAKADRFDRGGRAAADHEWDSSGLCLDERGEVTSVE